MSTVAIDAGQTGMKVRISDAGGAASEMLLPGVRTHEPLLPQLVSAVRAISERSGRPIEVASFGVSGLTDKDADAEEVLRDLHEVGVRTVLLAHDSVTSFLGALGDTRGAVIAAGTGVVTLGVGRSAVARVDGWGNIMGDAGSGYWIGRSALEAVMRAHDGRGPSTLLTDVVSERWSNIEDAYIELQGSPERVSIVASFAEHVAELAAADPVAHGIGIAAARELAQSTLTALRQVADHADDGEQHVCAIGGVFRAEFITRQFETLVSSDVAHVRIEPARGSGLDGAAALPGLVAGHPLHTLIAAASVAAQCTPVH